MNQLFAQKPLDGPAPGIGCHDITFKDVIDRIKRSGSNKDRDLAAVKGLMKWLSTPPKATVTADLVIGPDVLNDWPKTKEGYLEHCKGRIGKGAFANRRSAMESIWRHILALNESRLCAAEELRREDFKVAVRNALSKIGVTTYSQIMSYARPAGHWVAPHTSILPSESSREVLVKLENDARLPVGSLTKYIAQRTVVTPVADFSGHVVQYRNNVRLLMDKYCVTLGKIMHGRVQVVVPRTRRGRRKNPVNMFEDSILDPLRRDFEALLQHKTCDDPRPLVRGERWTRNRRGEYPTAARVLGLLEKFLGWLVMPKGENPECSGKGMDINDVSLSLFGCWDLVLEYMAFTRARAGRNEYFSGLAQMALTLFESLTNPQNGWFNQTEARRLGEVRRGLRAIGAIPDDATAAESEKIVGAGYYAAQHLASREWRKAVKPEFIKSRNPHDALSPFTSSKRPVKDLIFPMIANMMQDGPSKHAPLFARIQHARRVILIVSFFAIPLRLINWQHCEIGVNLRELPDGKYAIKITREEFKNRRFLKEGDDFHVDVPDWAQPFFRQWIKDWLPLLPKDGKGRQWLLPDMSGAPMTANAIQRTFYKAFKRYFGFGLFPHAARHIVATDYIKANPANVFVAAIVLNDDIKTVLKNYNHLIKSHHFSFFNTYISEGAEDILGKVAL